MSYLNVKNRAESTLASGISDSDLSLTVATGEGVKYPASNFMITIEDEILFCSSRSTDVLTVVRAQEGTAAAAHSADMAVELRITAGVVQNLERGCGQLNVETLSAGKTLTPGTDPMYQYLNPDNATRIVTLNLALAKKGDRFVIKSTGGGSLTIKENGTTLDYIWIGLLKMFIFDGVNWQGVGNGTRETAISIGYNAKGYSGGVAIGNNAIGNSYVVGIGYSANAGTNSVAIGRNAKATYGVGIGAYADAENYGIAIGDNTNTNLKKYSIALGNKSETERTGELSININGGDSDQENNIIIGGWEGQTANATPLEIFCGGQVNQRFLVRAKSVLAFTMLITARDNVSGDCAAYKVEGAIKRDAAGNTAMLVAATITPIHEDDASWDVAVAADDTNEALIITVTGDATNIVQWAARMDGVETHF